MLILCNEGHANHAVRGMPCTTPSVWTVGLVWTLCTECSALWAGTGLTLLSWITLMIKKTYLMFWWSVQYKHLHFHVPPDPYFCQFSVHNSISGWWNCVQKTVGCAFKIWNNCFSSRPFPSSQPSCHTEFSPSFNMVEFWRLLYIRLTDKVW